MPTNTGGWCNAAGETLSRANLEADFGRGAPAAAQSPDVRDTRTQREACWDAGDTLFRHPSGLLPRHHPIGLAEARRQPCRNSCRQAGGGCTGPLGRRWGSDCRRGLPLCPTLLRRATDIPYLIRACGARGIRTLVASYPANRISRSRSQVQGGPPAGTAYSKSLGRGTAGHAEAPALGLRWVCAGVGEHSRELRKQPSR